MTGTNKPPAKKAAAPKTRGPKGATGNQGNRGAKGEPGEPGDSMFQSDAYIRKADELQESLDAVGAELNKSNQKVFRLRLATAVAVIAAVGALASVIGNYRQDIARENERYAEVVGRCHQANLEALRVRALDKKNAEDLRALAIALRAGAPLPPQILPALDAYEAAAKHEVEKAYRIRDCTETGIAKFLEQKRDPAPCRPTGQGFCK